jgi:two-component system, chemotaxis family, sensor kinase CheA
MNEVIREFLLETHENLAQLDLDLVTLERDPTEKETLARVFRTLHTVKGTAGFLGLMKLQAVAHSAESLLNHMSAGEVRFNAAVAGALLATVDTIRKMLAEVEKTETDGAADHAELVQTLEKLRSAEASTPSSAPAAAKPAPRLPAKNEPAPAPRRAHLEEIEPELIARNGMASRTIVAPLSGPALRLDASEGGAGEGGRQHAFAVADSALRVDVGLLDKLMTLVGELVLARNQIVQYSASQQNSAFLGTVQRLDALTTELQAGVMKTRMQPIGNIWGKFPRLVRDLAVACGKQVRFEMAGRDTELDKTIIEAIRDPLIHMIRNGIDHGIETPAERLRRDKPLEGLLNLRAYHEGGKVIIELADDGAGIDPERIQEKALQAKLVSPAQAAQMTPSHWLELVFQPGFSTADKVTHFSGRGVGMSVVGTQIAKIGGTVEIDSTVGFGTTIRIKIPLTLAIVPALTVTSAGDCYVIPQISLLELIRLEGAPALKGLEHLRGVPVYRLRGTLLPLVYLDEQLELRPRGAQAGVDATVHIVVLQADGHPFGLVVDAIHDTEEIVVKPLQALVKGSGVFAGATIMGDGRVALILDVLGLAQRAHVVSSTRERTVPDISFDTSPPASAREAVLVFAAPNGRRLGIPLAEVARLEEVPCTALEKTGKQAVVQYRDEILPLIDVADVLPVSLGARHGLARVGPDRAPHEETVQIVVHAHHGRRLGLVVGRILDIAEEVIVTRSRVKQPFVLFTAVIQGHVTEVLDVAGIIGFAEPEFYRERAALTLEA